MDELIDYLSDPVNILDELVGIHSSISKTEITQELVDSYKRVAKEIMQTPARREFDAWLGLLGLVIDDEFWNSSPIKVQNRVASLWVSRRMQLNNLYGHDQRVRSLLLFIRFAVDDYWKSKGLEDYVHNAAITHETRFQPWQRKKLLR